MKHRPPAPPLDPFVEAAAKGQFVRAIDSRRPKKRKRTSKNRIRAPPPNVIGAFSVPQFLAAHGGLSPAMYFKLKKAGKGPREMRVGRRILISFEAAAAWRREREEAKLSEPTDH
jgi:hypothetical protein